MKLSNTAIKELSAKYRSILQKCAFLNVLILGVTFATGALATGTNIIIYYDTGPDVTEYIDPDVGGTFAVVCNHLIGSEVNSIKTDTNPDNHPVDCGVAGIMTSSSTSADSITGGINLTTTGNQAFGILAVGGTTNVKGLGEIAVQAETTYGISSQSDDEDFENNVTFTNGSEISSTSTGTGNSDEAFGITAAGNGKTKVEGLGGITVKAEKTASGIYNMGFYSDFENSVKFANEGTISSESKTDVTYGIASTGIGTTTIKNLKSITTVSNKEKSYGIYSEGSDEFDFSNLITFVKNASIVSIASKDELEEDNKQEAYGIFASALGITTVSVQGGGATIEVSGNSGSSKVHLQSNAVLNLDGFNLTNTSGVNTISANASDGDTPTLNLTNTTVAGRIYTGNVSEGGIFNMNVGQGSSLKWNDITFLTVETEGTFNLNFTGGAIDLHNNAISANTLPASTNISGTPHIYADVDLASETMDTLSKGTAKLDGDTQINVSKLYLLSDATEDITNIQFADNNLKAVVSYTGEQGLSYSPKYTYDITYDKTTGEFIFTRKNGNEGLNPSLYASSTVSQTVGLLQSDIINVAFDGLNTGNSAKFSEKKGDDTPKDNAWVKVIGVDDNVDFDSFKTVDSEMFSLMAGMNTKDIKVGSADMKFGFYAGYLNGEQKYTDNKIEQDGGYLGLSTSWTKGNIVLNGTINGGFMNNEAENTFGTDKYDTFWTGVGIKAGYNYDLGSALTLQPNVYAGYTLVDTEDYTSKSGVRIKNDKTHLFEVAPGFKLSKDFQNYWKGYAQAKYAILADKGGDVNADDLALSNISADNYAEYGIGLEKAFANAWGMNMTINRRDGGRQGWNGSVEMKYNF